VECYGADVRGCARWMLLFAFGNVWTMGFQRSSRYCDVTLLFNDGGQTVLALGSGIYSGTGGCLYLRTYFLTILYDDALGPGWRLVSKYEVSRQVFIAMSVCLFEAGTGSVRIHTYRDSPPDRMDELTKGTGLGAGLI